MLGQVYFRYSDRFGTRPNSATLKKKLGEFKLSNLIFTLARINVLLGWQRLFGESDDKKKLQGLLVANFIDDDILNAPLQPLLANEFLKGQQSPQVVTCPRIKFRFSRGSKLLIFCDWACCCVMNKDRCSLMARQPGVVSSACVA